MLAAQPIDNLSYSATCSYLLLQKQRRQQQCQERQRQRRENRQIMKEKRSGLFRQEEVMALSVIDTEEAVDIDILT